MRERNAFFQLVCCLSGVLTAKPDWVGVIRHANRHLVGPELFRSIERAGIGPEVEPEAFDYLASMNEANQERNACLGSQLSEFVSQMARLDIKFCLTKGAVELCIADRSEDVARILFDIDVVIAAADEAFVNNAMIDLGYQNVEGSQSDYSIGRFIRDDVVGAIDVHKTMPERFFGVIADEEFHAQAEIARFAGQNVCIPDISLRLAINIANEMMHDRGVFTGFLSLRHLLELKGFLETKCENIEWTMISKKFANQRMKLGYELQSRMLYELFAPVAFPNVELTRLGGILHRRRVIKAMFPLMGDFEWRVVRSMRKLF